MIQVDKNLCPHNHACPLVGICPVGAITQNSDGFPEVDHDICIECQACVESCRMNAMKNV